MIVDIMNMRESNIYSFCDDDFTHDEYSDDPDFPDDHIYIVEGVKDLASKHIR